MFDGMSTATIVVENKSLALPRSTPEAQGISSAAILDFIEVADAKIDAIHSFMLVRHGHIVAEGWWSPYAADVRHVMFSLSKSFASTAMGMAIAEGRLSVHDPVLKFFPGDAPAEVSENLKAMRVSDLLMMATGQRISEVSQLKLETTRNVPKAFLEVTVDQKPGTSFWYNTPASYMLSAIVQKLTGQTILDYLGPRLFEPLGIEDPTWDTSVDGVSLGGYGLNIKTEDIAKFGLLYLNKGNWHGRRLLPANWVEKATGFRTSNGSNPDSDWDQGYGYQFWRARHGLYRGDGAFGQFCIVFPEQDAVVAITAGVKDMGSVMNLLWEKILPALGNKALVADVGTAEKLKARMEGLSIKAEVGSTKPGTGVKSGKRFVFGGNDQKVEAVALEFGRGEDGDTLVLKCDGAEHQVRCGHGEWAKGKMTYSRDGARRPAEELVAARSGWVAENVYRAKIVFYETPFCITVNLKFEGERVLYDAEYNVAFRPSGKMEQLVGRGE